MKSETNVERKPISTRVEPPSGFLEVSKVSTHPSHCHSNVSNKHLQSKKAPTPKQAQHQVDSLKIKVCISIHTSFSPKFTK